MNSPTPAAPAEQLAFEHWCITSHNALYFDRLGNGEYANQIVQAAWESWQARATLQSPEPSELAVGYGDARQEQFERDTLELRQQLLRMTHERDKWQDIVEIRAKPDSRQAVIEECAKVCDAIVEKFIGREKQADTELESYTQGIERGAEKCADRIRALATGKVEI